MTTTVRVEARAWGATVETNGETIELGPHADRTFHIAEGESQSFTVTHGERPADAAPATEAEGSPPSPATSDSNESGADETARTTSQAVEPPTQRERGRGPRGAGATE